jgi:hypothetical protein
MLQLTKYFISTPQAKALGAWGLATPLDAAIVVTEAVAPGPMRHRSVIALAETAIPVKPSE